MPKVAETTPAIALTRASVSQRGGSFSAHAVELMPWSAWSVVIGSGLLPTRKMNCGGLYIPAPLPLAHARPCLSTGWALNCRFEQILGPLFLWSRLDTIIGPSRHGDNYVHLNPIHPMPPTVNNDKQNISRVACALYHAL